MPQGDPGEHFGGTMGYGGQFPGYGGSRGYTGGQNNPSSSGGGTAGQTQASQHYAGLIRGYAPGGVAGSIGMGGLWSPAVTTSSQNPDLPQNKPGPKVSGKKPPPSIDPVTGLPTLTPAQIAAGVTFPEPIVDEEIVNYPGPGLDISNLGGYGAYGQAPFGWGTKDQSRVPVGAGGNPYDTSPVAPSRVPAGRQFGGPVAPGRQYTVGENGPETLQMGPGGGGQVIPNNPADRLGGMNPQTLQALFQMMQQRQGGGGGFQGQSRVAPAPMPGTSGQSAGSGGFGNAQAGGGMGLPRPATPTPAPGGGGFRLGDWRNRMGIEGLSRPPSSMGFGGSGLGMPGVMPQLANRGGLGGGTRMG